MANHHQAMLASTLTRWRSIETGRLLVAVAVKEDDGVRSVLPVRFHGLGHESYAAPHPMDWLPETSFLREFEAVDG
jgi:hypothetical protein